MFKHVNNCYSTDISSETAITHAEGQKCLWESTNFPSGKSDVCNTYLRGIYRVLSRQISKSLLEAFEIHWIWEKTWINDIPVLIISNTRRNNISESQYIMSCDCESIYLFHGDKGIVDSNENISANAIEDKAVPSEKLNFALL